MKIAAEPIRTTIFFGLLGGLTFVPLSLGLNHCVPWPKALALALGCYLAVYGILLVRWSAKSSLQIIIPLLLLGATVLPGQSIAAFLLLCPGVLSWMRSGICFPTPVVPKIGVEILLAMGGAGLVAVFRPSSPIAWGLGIWLFFLVQSLYFVVFEPATSRREDTIPTDSFEQARLRAEKILSAEFRRRGNSG
ncbi:MAG: hypothetical protein JSW39_20370 [Desulfobacterales bacterium]|nr:MAG: hypothetical protein JSW39_20370 [Desulfobacterales bacterium]